MYTSNCNSSINTFVILFFILILIDMVVRNNVSLVIERVTSKVKKYCNTINQCFNITDKEKDEFNVVKDKLITLHSELLKHIPQNDSRHNRLKNKFNKNNVYEVYPHNKQKDTSYSINKGQEIHMCIRSGEDFNKIHDINIIKFVFIHELAHVITVEEQHTGKFWSNFKYLLNIAEKNGLIENYDYEKFNREYCSLNIDYNPIYDNSVNIHFS